MSLAQGVLLGPAARRPANLTIHVPRGYETQQEPLIGHCTVPGCKAEFFKGQEELWQKHVGFCARANMDKIMAQVEAHRASPFNERNWDPETAAHLRGVGKRMLEEGRMTMKPSERAGL